MVYIDPPQGWRYGFPKELPAGWRDWTREDIAFWLFSQGYPPDKAFWAADLCKITLKEDKEG